MDTHEIKAQAVRFKSARSNLMLVIVLTTISVFLAAMGSNFVFFFSAPFPLYVFHIASVFYGGLTTAGVVVSVVIAIIAIGVYFLCWWLSKKFRVFILIALIFFSIEVFVNALFMLSVLFSGYFDIGSIVGMAFHGWILYCLIGGTIAWAKLSGATPEEIQSAQQEAAAELSREETNSAMDEISGDE